MSAKILTATLLLLATAAPALAYNYSGVTVAGDSLTDGGNVFAYSGGTLPYPSGRFSDGPTWVERLATDLGHPITPSALGGTNLAFGGAESGMGTTLLRGVLPVPGVQQQVANYIALNPTLDPYRLYVLWGGANDLFNGQVNPAIPAANITAAVLTLVNAGAKRILVNDLPNLGLAPEFRGTPYQTPMTQLSLGFNTLLASNLKAISGATVIESNLDKVANPNWDSNPNLTIFHFQTNTLFEDMISHPENYNLTNSATPAFDANTLSLTGNPATYLFWDTIHPTTAAHQIMGDAAYALATPEPASLGVLCLTATTLLLRRKQRSSYS